MRNGLVMLLCLTACGRHHASAGAASPSSPDSDSDAIVVDNDADSLAAHLTESGSKVDFDVTSTSTAASLDLLPLLPPTITLAATLAPPSIGGVTMQANGIIVSGKLAYISYNLQGNTQSGAIDVVDLTTPASPKLVSEALFPTSDINGLAVDSTNGFLYAVGATSTGTSEVFLSKITLASGLLTSTVTTVGLTSYAGTGVDLSSTLVYATSGDGGGVQIFNKTTMAPVASLSIKDARSVIYSTTDSAAWVASGQPGTLTEVSAAGASLKTIAVGGAATPDSKSTVQELSAGVLLMSTGEAGASAVCKSTGTSLATVAPVTVSGLTAAQTVTNAATWMTGPLSTYVFTADGEAGVYGASYVTAAGLGLCLSLSLGLSGHLVLGAGDSANAVYASGTNLFVSSGIAGLKILNLSF